MKDLTSTILSLYPEEEWQCRKVMLIGNYIYSLLNETTKRRHNDTTKNSKFKIKKYVISLLRHIVTTLLKKPLWM